MSECASGLVSECGTDQPVWPVGAIPLRREDEARIHRAAQLRFIAWDKVCCGEELVLTIFYFFGLTHPHPPTRHHTLTHDHTLVPPHAFHHALAPHHALQVATGSNDAMASKSVYAVYVRTRVFV